MKYTQKCCIIIFMSLFLFTGCGSFIPEKALENYLKAKTPSQRFNWITSESKKRFSRESFVKYYEKYNPTEKILEMRRFPIDDSKYIRLRVRREDAEGTQIIFYTLKRDNLYSYRVCWSYLLHNEAAKHMNNKQWEEARSIVKEAILLDPYNEYNLFLMAEININTDRREEAWGNLSKAMELNPNDIQAFLTASQYWAKEDKEKSSRYAEQATKIAETNFDADPSADSSAKKLIRAIAFSNLQESLFQRKDILKNNIVHYSTPTASFICVYILPIIYDRLYKSKETDLQKDFDEWFKLASEKYKDDIYVKKLIHAIETENERKKNLQKYLSSSKGRLEMKIYDVLGDNYIYSFKYSLANVEDGIKMIAMKGSMYGGADFSLIKDYDELDWLDQFEKIRKLINTMASQTGIDTWYAKKKFWSDWLFISEDKASKLASNF